MDQRSGSGSLVLALVFFALGAATLGGALFLNHDEKPAPRPTEQPVATATPPAHAEPPAPAPAPAPPPTPTPTAAPTPPPQAMPPPPEPKPAATPAPPAAPPTPAPEPPAPPQPKPPEPRAKPSPAARSVTVARAAGGTEILPLGDPAKLAALQGLDGSVAATMTMTFPLDDQLLDDARLALVPKWLLQNFDVGKDEASRGNHLHVELDSRDAIDDWTSEGVTRFEAADLTQGTHILTVFPVRSNDVAIKTPGTTAELRFHWHARGGLLVPEPGAPRIVYNLPRGDYRGDAAKNIVCDFLLLRVPEADLASGKVKIVVSVDGSAGTGVDDVRVERHDPHPFVLLEDAKPGSYDVVIELRDRNGDTFGGRWNRQFRKFRVLPPTPPEDAR